MDFAGLAVAAAASIVNLIDDFSPGHAADAKAKSDTAAAAASVAAASVAVAKTQADAQKAMALYGAIAVAALMVGVIAYRLVA